MDDTLAKLKKQAEKNAAGQTRLEELVVQAHQEGSSLREIGAAARLTAEGVRRMVARIQGS